jgi:hypothetical protein
LSASFFASRSVACRTNNHSKVDTAIYVGYFDNKSLQQQGAWLQHTAVEQVQQSRRRACSRQLTRRCCNALRAVC